MLGQIQSKIRTSVASCADTARLPRRDGRGSWRALCSARTPDPAPRPVNIYVLFHRDLYYNLGSTKRNFLIDKVINHNKINKKKCTVFVDIIGIFFIQITFQ